MLNMPLQAGFDLEQVGIAPFATLTTQPGLLGGKVHGSLARAGKVKGQTPKVDAEEKKKAKTGRAKRRMQVSIFLIKITFFVNDFFKPFLSSILVYQIYHYILKYNRRFVNVVPSFGKKKGPNSNS